MCINFLYDSCYDRRIYGFIPDRTADDKRTCSVDHSDDRRMAVLYVVCQPSILDHEHFQTMRNAPGDFCDYYRAGISLFIDVYRIYQKNINEIKEVATNENRYL